MVNSQFTHHEIESSSKRIHLYTSSVTGLTCINVDLDLPTVSGYFALATECFDDKGEPHTLEHLVFLGSEKWPYKGVLDSLANRAFAQGTNAWTDTDHTAYTIETVGQEGFLRLLPIFVDHILYPTLTPSGCYTEVHHINGKGEDAGVVYSEMQGVENTGPSIMSLYTQRAIHDEKSGYRSETGGILNDVRNLSVAEIQNYHAHYYVPHNLVLVITGRLEQQDLMSTLEDVDKNIQAHGTLDKSAWKRPWLESNPQVKLKESRTEVLDFPEEDESMGEVSISWPGPSCTDHLDVCALDLVGQYLTHSAISPLQDGMVEIEDPLCTDIDFYTSDRLKSIISASLASVPTEMLEDAEKKFFEILQQTQSSDIDMKRMQALIVKDKLKVKNAVESDPHSAFSTPIIVDYVYGSRDGASLRESLDDEKYLDIVSKWSSAEWQEFIRRWLLDNPHLTILGKPSAEMAKKVQEDEVARIAAQVEKLGDKGLSDLEKRLHHAQTTNDMPIPNDLIQNFPVPSVDGINFIRPKSARGGLEQKGLPKLSNSVQELVNTDDCQIPLSIQFDDIAPSEFASISLYLTCTTVEKDLLPYIGVLLHSFFLVPVERDGKEMTYEEVVEQLELDTISYSASFGAGSGFNELVRIKLKVEVSKYATGIAWINDLLYNSILDGERIALTISKILNDLPSYKRDGDTVASSVLGALQLDASKSAARTANLLDQTKFLEQLDEELEEDEDAVIAQFEKLRGQLARYENMRVHVVAEVAKLSKPVSTWSSFGPRKQAKRPRADSIVLNDIPLSRDLLTPYAAAPSGDCRVVTISTDSCYSQHFAKGLADFNHPDLPALFVITSYLNAMEGLLWKYIRGSGLAYGADLKVDTESGLVFFSIYRSPDAFLAWDKAREIMIQLRDGKLDIDEMMIDGAKSSMVYDFVSRESTPGAAAHQSYVNQVLKKQSSEYRRDLLKKIAAVTLPEMKEMLGKYLVGLFEPEKTNTVIVCGTKKSAEQVKGFSEAGFRTTNSSLEDFEKEYIK
ncbi:putative Zinc metalloprotease [Taphrina deformans PYCC 5710]|uniref:Zinc metalloprotease n=1 Tax=Taphrina deformans (strain PYCC 5710 / ATCC 11124 / CBS 356.35 / IMI 108563 / JCM 9778 / NBRC 8474) TaxID=1097556 RepID=R4XFJ3_TAPDE|nr:putative Zinc metalloprotease [Taphrina deformans PYCC 5710]|eukprot:CCG82102.1 putative Zinc metalloprotease [Taphrina deformans PYCC 5710]